MPRRRPRASQAPNPCVAPPPRAIMAEWSLVKVVLHADKAKEPAIYQVAAYVGSGNDKAVCIFCGEGFAALVDRLPVTWRAPRYNAHYIFNALPPRYNALRSRRQAFEPSQIVRRRGALWRPSKTAPLCLLRCADQKPHVKTVHSKRVLQRPSRRAPCCRPLPQLCTHARASGATHAAETRVRQRHPATCVVSTALRGAQPRRV